MGRHYAIWVQDWYTGTLVSTFYLRSGEVIEAELPLGTYRLAFAVGQGWQDHKLLFGATTTITRAKHPFGTLKGGQEANRNAQGWSAL